MIIAIDGPAASGKSSTARRVAERLGFRHVDSGALYRAVAAARLRNGGAAEHWTEDDVLAEVARITFVPTAGGFAPMIDGRDADADIRGPAVTAAVSLVAQMPRVRAWVNARVREAAADHDVVVDGRDMGTAVFPDAELKVFLIADPWERARRRLLQRGVSPADADIAAETNALVERDSHDAVQSTPALDAVLIDTTYITQDEQVERIVALAKTTG